MLSTQTFHEHILELRKRILWIFIAILLSGFVGFTLRVRIIKFIQKPLGYSLYYTNPAGSFNFEIKIAVIISLFIALPVIVYQFLRFIGPALSSKMTKWLMLKIIVASFSLASLGILFGYYVIVPLSLHFFARYSTAQLKPLISADSYLSYLVNNLVIFALVFQIPLIILFINRLKPLKPRRMLHYQRHVIVGSLALAVALPFTYDPISQFVVALPIVFLYYLSVLFVWYANRHLKKKGNRPQQAADTSATSPLPNTPVSPEPSFTSSLGSMAASRSIDGIISSSVASQPTPMKLKSPDTSPKQNTQPLPRFMNLGQSIDGIYPMLHSSPNTSQQ